MPICWCAFAGVHLPVCICRCASCKPVPAGVHLSVCICRFPWLSVASRCYPLLPMRDSAAMYQCHMPFTSVHLLVPLRCICQVRICRFPLLPVASSCFSLRPVASRMRLSVIRWSVTLVPLARPPVQLAVVDSIVNPSSLDHSIDNSC